MDKDIEQDGNRRVVTAKVCRNNFVVSLVLVLVFSLGGLFLLSPGPSHIFRFRTWDVCFALLSAADAIMFGFQAYKNWKRYNAIQGGAVIYDKVRTTNEDWVLTSAGAIVLLTLIAALVSGVSLWQWQFLGAGHFIVALLTGALWAYTLFCWYRLLFRRPKVAAPAETQEGVWPPPPIRPDDPPT